ncbi:hypothetical protein HJ044_05000 [Vibrio parahaemolyticus]|nr:hypothetical protein [Vibrio parahaemolyticus]
MDIKEFKGTLFNEKPLELICDDHSEKVRCVFSINKNEIIVSSELEKPSDIGRNRETVDLHYYSDLVEAKITVSMSKHNFLSFEANVREMIIESKHHHSINNISYIIAGADSWFDRNNFEWSRNYEINKEIYHVNYSFIQNQILTRIDPDLNSKSDEFIEISRHIEDEVFVMCQSYSFCRGTKVEWVVKTFLNDINDVRYHYISSNAPSKFYNLINPMRSDNDLWQRFIQHVVDKQISKKELVDNQVFQAINNIIWNGSLNEWTLIAHASALEGLCKKTEISVIETKEYKKIRKFLLKNLSDNLHSFNMTEDCFNTIKQNICDNERTLNGFPTKWYINEALNFHGLEKYSSDNLSKISKAIGMRNKIVHEGWSDKWDLDMYDYIKILRDTICLLVFSFYDYSGGFYLLNEDNTVTLSDYRK